MDELRKTSSLPDIEETPQAVLYNRSDATVILTALLSVAMLWSSQLVMVGIAGLSIVACFLLTSKKEKVMEIYPDRVVLHQPGHEKQDVILPVHAISKWQILNGQKAGAQIHFQLVDGRHTAVETLTGVRAYAILHRAFPDREYSLISSKKPEKSGDLKNEED